MNVASQFDATRPIVEEVRRILADGLASAERQAPGSDPRTFIVNLPGFAISATVLTTLWVLSYGQFPTVLRLRAVPGTVPAFEVAEIVDLNMIATS